MKLAWDSARRMKKAEGYDRERSDDLYHTSRWTKLAREWKVSHPLCERCKAEGIYKAAQVVDHIIPFPICKDFFFDRTNLQSLCEDCNRQKGQEDKKRIQEWKSRASEGEGGSNLLRVSPLRPRPESCSHENENR